MTQYVTNDGTNKVNSDIIDIDLTIWGEGIEIFNTVTSETTFSPGFDVVLTNKLQNKSYYDYNGGCMIKIKGEESKYKFSGYGFMDQCKIIYDSSDKTFTVGNIEKFNKLFEPKPKPTICEYLQMAIIPVFCAIALYLKSTENNI
jgi:hypothetical protein